MAYILQPAIFLSLLVVLFAVSMFIVLFFLRQGSKFSKLDESFKNEIYSKEELYKKMQDLQDQVAQLKNELTIKSQMYDGLKGQYEELEKDFESLVQKTEKIQQGKELYEAQQKPDETKTAQKPSSDESVIRLLKNLQDLQGPAKNPCDKTL